MLFTLLLILIERERQLPGIYLRHLKYRTKRRCVSPLMRLRKTLFWKPFSTLVPINMPKVNAQQARRILDRLVGYQISPLLWKKIAKGLSAGRVQSVAVRLIVEREKEIKEFKPQEYWKITAELKIFLGDTKKPEDVKTFKALLQKFDSENVEVKNEQQTKDIINELQKAEYIVANVKKQTKRNNAPPPFTTSLLQQAGVHAVTVQRKENDAHCPATIRGY